VKGVLGRGMFSVVYEGERLFGNKIVALKTYNKSLMKEKHGGIEMVKN